MKKRNRVIKILIDTFVVALTLLLIMSTIMVITVKKQRKDQIAQEEYQNESKEKFEKLMDGLDGLIEEYQNQ